jgi:cytochrome c-type biogenesis protein CcmH/NrfG
VAEYRRLIEASPKYARAHGGLASIYSKQGKLREALASFETALRLEPDNAQARSGAEEVRQRLVASGRKPPVNPGP